MSYYTEDQLAYDLPFRYLLFPVVPSGSFLFARALGMASEPDPAPYTAERCRIPCWRVSDPDRPSPLGAGTTAGCMCNFVSGVSARSRTAEAERLRASACRAGRHLHRRIHPGEGTRVGDCSGLAVRGWSADLGVASNQKPPAPDHGGDNTRDRDSALTAGGLRRASDVADKSSLRAVSPGDCRISASRLLRKGGRR